MKKRLLLLLIAILVLPIAAHALTFTFEWTPSEIPGEWDYIDLFDRENAGTYDYQNASNRSAQTYVDGVSQPIEMQYTVDPPQGVVTTYYFVVRAIDATIPTAEFQSADSNEVTFVADMTPLDAFTFTAVYNEPGSSIDFAWVVEDTRAYKYKIYTRNVTEGEGTYTQELAEIMVSDGITSAEVPMDSLYPDGEITERAYTMVSFNDIGAYSPNAQEVSITIDRRSVNPVMNFTIKLYTE